MSIKQLCISGSIVAALAMASGVATAADSGQTIYLDPQTGKVIPHPAPGSPGSPGTPPGAQATSGDAGPKQGGGRQRRQARAARGQSADPVSASNRASHKARIVHCADGSLRMGSVGRDDAQDKHDPEALCGRPVD
ncbi:hypothetical protein ACS8Y6_10385 [Salinisphaera sp. RV14]|uniref:hypothetical protein n=1 Tax=unclassified Salinisphaera TaxID=2649847 RepID=UPI003F828C60